MWIFVVLGCGLVDKAKGDINDLGNNIAGIVDSTVLQGSVIGVKPPD